MFTKEQLVEMGVPADVAERVIKEQNAKKEHFVPKDRFDEVTTEVKTLKGTITERDNQITALKKFEGSNAELQEKLAKLEAENTAKLAEYEAAAKLTAKKSAVKVALLGEKSRPHDLDMVLGLIDIDKVAVDDKNTITNGLTDQLTALQKDKAFLFTEAGEPKPDKKDNFNFFGFTPAEGKEGKAPTKEEQAVALGKAFAQNQLTMLGIDVKKEQ